MRSSSIISSNCYYGIFVLGKQGNYEMNRSLCESEPSRVVEPFQPTRFLHIFERYQGVYLGH